MQDTLVCPSPTQRSLYPALARILHPFPVARFLEEYWEKKPLHIVRNNPDYYRHLFSLEQLDAFHAYSPTNDNTRLAKDGVSVPAEVSGVETMTISQFYESYQKGYTVVTRNIHERVHPIAEVANQLYGEFGCYISTHLYPTPERSQGFSSHWDDHDIFALQLEGAKHWRLYDGGPIKPRLNDASLEAPKQTNEDPGEPNLSIMLEAGDLLYFPRGVIHKAVAQEKRSLHLTYGLYVRTPEHVIKQALINSPAPALDTALPLGFFRAGAPTDAVASQVADAVAGLQDALDFETALIDIGAETVQHCPALPSGHFHLLAAPPELGPDTRVVRRKGCHAVLKPRDTDAVLTYPGARWEEPTEMVPALTRLCGPGPVRLGDLPGDATGVESLVRRYLQRGFLALA